MTKCLDKMHELFGVKRTVELCLFLMLLLLVGVAVNQFVPGTSDADRAIGLGFVVIVALLGAVALIYAATLPGMPSGLIMMPSPRLEAAVIFVFIAIIYGAKLFHAVWTLHWS